MRIGKTLTQTRYKKINTQCQGKIMEKILNIYQRIVAVMKEVKYVQKSDRKVNNMYSFVTHDSVSAALHEPMANHGIVMVPSVAELIQDGNRTIIKMEISFINADDPTDKITVHHYGYGIDPQDKGIGKAISYAVKYALLKLFCLETGDDVEKDSIDYVPKEAMVNNELLRNALTDRKKLIIELAGKENKEDLIVYIDKLKKTFKSKTEEELFLSKEAPDFVKDFVLWKDKQQKAA